MIQHSALIKFTSLLLAAFMLVGCGDDAQERYEEAIEAMEEAREEREEAKKALQEKEEELKEFRARLDEAEEELDEAREQMDEARAKVNASVNDEVLFRTLQRKMLEPEHFDESAIAVGVSDRVVTLTGTVPDQKTRKKALEIARNQSGVAEVVDFIEVEGAQDKKQQKKNEEKNNNKDKKQSQE